MLYLEFYHISDLGTYLQENNVREAFCHIMSEGPNHDACRHITISARVGDHIAISTFSFRLSEGLSEEDADLDLGKRSTSLVNDLKNMGISVKAGRWTDKTPIGLTDDLLVESILREPKGSA